MIIVSLPVQRLIIVVAQCMLVALAAVLNMMLMMMIFCYSNNEVVQIQETKGIDLLALSGKN